MKLVILIIFNLIMSVTQVFAQPDRISIMFGSQHVNAKMRFNQENPGIFATWEHHPLDLTIGVYKNSFSRASLALTVALPLHRTRDFSLDLFFGAAYYPVDGRYFAYHIGDIVPVGGLQVRYQNLFAQVIPSDGTQTDAILSFGVTFSLH